MALVQQTYPVVTPGANSYGTVVGFKAYHGAKGNPIAAYADAQIEQALIQATEYMDMRFKYVGMIADYQQSTVWPRRNVWNIEGYLENGIPNAVLKANYEYAIKHLQLQPGGLLPDPTRDPTGRAIKESEVIVGPLRQRTNYEEGARYAWPIYPLPDGILKAKGFVLNTRGSGGIRVSDLGRG